MKNNVYGKNIIRTITGSLGRFISILAIIALGVGFFAGVKVTKDSMIKTCNTYVQEYDMYDFRLVSTLGFEEDEIKTLGEVPGIREAEGSITKDIFSLDKRGNQVIYKAHSITDSINKTKLAQGRMPKNANECVGDKDHFTAGDIGRTIRVTDENLKDTRESFRHRNMKLVGLVSTPVYISRTERGTAAIGDGSIDAYIYVPMENFKDDYFTEAYLTMTRQGYIFSPQYDRNIKAVKRKVKKTGEQCGQDRYDEILAKAEEKLQEGRGELNRGRNTLNTKKAEAYSKLNQGKAKLDAKSAELESGAKQLEEAIKTLPETKRSLENTLQDLNGKKQYAEANLELAEEALKNVQASGNEETIKVAEAAVAEAQRAVTAINDGIAQAEAGLARVNSEIAAIPSRAKQIAEGRQAIKKGYADYRKGLAKAESKFSKAEEEIAQGKRKLLQEEKKLKDLEEPKLYLQTRNDNLGYVSYDSNSDIVDSIAKVFPIFFFLIAALVCSTTMSRMIEEERPQIGTLRALGYSNRRIMRKYMIYSGSAAVIGCVGGFLLGTKLFPLAIFTAYQMLFDFAPLEYYFSMPLAVASLVVSLICSAGTTYMACRSQLREMPALILLPKAPKAGKRVLLERIEPLWKNLKFIHKVSLRNVFRYKKRMIMMIAGISGCTALVLAGFGIYDSVGGITEHQYNEIEKYDITVAFEKEITEKTEKEFKEALGKDLETFAVAERATVNAKASGKIRSCNLMVSQDGDVLTKLINFRSNDGEEEPLGYPGKGKCLVNNKLAELMGVLPGDSLTVEYDDTKKVSLQVSGVYRNYVDNYIYISDETYEDEMNKVFSPSIILTKVKEGDDVRAVAGKISNFNGVAGMVLNEDTRHHVEEMMKSLDYVVWLVIACAGALAFIVLFNLTNINITERIREIATIRVLGFYRRETGAYVLRENLILVAMGIVVGIPLGLVLHKFIMSMITVDDISFTARLEPISYLYTVVAVICFTLIVDVIMRKKLSGINMAEALKSVE